MKYNANFDKGSVNVYGLTEEYPLAESWEFLNNTSDACLFHGPVAENWTEDFEARHPDNYEDMTNFKIMHNWVVSTWQDGATGNALSEAYIGVDGTNYTNDTPEYRLAKFKKEFTEHFDFDFCLVYYIFTFVMLMVDQRAKNMFLTTWDGIHYQPWFYDNDTCLGINNEGVLVFDYYHEDNDKLGTANVYNGAESTLWVNFRESFSKEIKELYQELRSNGLLSYDKIIEYFATNQSDKWSISIYNEDSDYKYISMLRSDGDATNLYQIRGTGKEHLKYFIKNRLMYLDSKWYGADYADDYASLRIYTPSGDLAVAPNADITVTPFSDIYAGVMYRANGTLRQQRAKKNTPITFKAPQETFNDTETAIYGASEIASLGDLSPLYCGTVNVSKAKKLVELIVGSNIEGYSNPNLRELSVGTNKLLKKINICNCPNFNSSLQLANCPNIQEIYATGSGITGLELPSSGYLKKVYLPGTLTNLTVTNQQYIEEFSLEGYGNLTTLRIEKAANIPVEDIMLNAPNLNRIRLLDISWEAKSEDALRQTIEKFKSCLGLDANGNNIDKAVVTGYVKVPSISNELYNDIYENFPNLVVDDGSGKPYIINFLDRNGNSLFVTRLAKGEDAFDPIETGDIEKPADIVTEDARYIFTGWSTMPTNVSSHYRITPVYKTQYAVKYYNDTTLLYTEYIDQGSAAPDPVLTGTITTPTKDGTDDLHYTFSGWDNLPTNIQKTMNVYAQFTNVYPVRYYSDDSSTLHYTQWVIEGQDAFDPVASGDVTAPTKESTVDDMFYGFSAWDNIPTNVSAITSVHAVYDIYWAVRFYNDTIEVDMQKVKEGASAVNPITRENNPIEIPTKESTAQYDFTFSKWDSDYTNITAATKVYAVYSSTIRVYTVSFYNMENLLYTVENIQYGSSATYSGDIPTKLGVDDPENYDFVGWNPNPEYITGETKCYALFRYKGYLQDDWDTIAANVANGTAVDLYPIGARKEFIITLLDGNEYTVDVEIIAHNHDNLADDSGKATLTFFCKSLPGFYRRMDDANTDGWAASEMREFINGELLNALPEKLRTVIKPVYKISDGGANNKSLVTTTDSCWLASYNEVGLVDGTNNLTGQGEIYSQTFTYGSGENTSRVRYLPDGYTPGGWWLRTSRYGSLNESPLFYRIINKGGAYGDVVTNLFYVAFGFCI